MQSLGHSAKYLRAVWTPLLLVAVTLTLLLWTLRDTHRQVGSPFPGYLQFSNGVAGIFYLPSWKEVHGDISYPKSVPQAPGPGSIFTESDFFLSSALPATAGFLLVLLGAAVYFFLQPQGGLLPLLFFHWLLGNFFILLTRAQFSPPIPPLFLLCLIFLPPAMLHFSLLISEMLVHIRSRWIYTLSPYVLSVALSLPYLHIFNSSPENWVLANFVVLGYGILAYLFWLLRLVWIIQMPNLEIDRIFAQWLLVGQLAGLLLPGGLILGGFFLGIAIPLNFAAPLLLFFPLALFAGMLPGKRRQQEIYIVQSEKRSTFGNLLAGLAHELNNPLTFIYSNIDLLRDRLTQMKRNPELREDEHAQSLMEMEDMVSGLEEGANRVRALIQDFGTLPFKKREPKEPLDLNKILEQSIQLLSPKWKDRLRLETRWAKLPKIEGYPLELGQAFTNILANAFDATPQNGRVNVSTQAGGSGVKIIVRDTGKGIPRENLGKIFDPLFTTKAQGEGMGLGLSICLQKIKNHKGTVEVKSEEGKGTEFLIFIPYTS